MPTPGTTTTDAASVTSALLAEMAQLRAVVTRYSLDANKRAQADNARQSFLTRLSSRAYSPAHLVDDINTVARAYQNNPGDEEACTISRDLFAFARDVSDLMNPLAVGDYIAPEYMIPLVAEKLRGLDDSPTANHKSELVTRAEKMAKSRKHLQSVLTVTPHIHPSLFPRGYPPSYVPPSLPQAHPGAPLALHPATPETTIFDPRSFMHSAPPPRQAPSDNAPRGPPRHCYNCRAPGHIARDCPHPPQPRSESDTRNVNPHPRGRNGPGPHADRRDPPPPGYPLPGPPDRR